MKLLSMGAAVALSLTLVVGMGSKSKTAPLAEAPKVLPESTRASTPATLNTPVELIENTAEENKKVEDSLNAPATHQAPVKAKVKKVKAPKKVKAAVVKKKKATSVSKLPTKQKKSKKKN